MSASHPKLVSIAAAAARYRITPKTLRAMIAAGEIPAYRISQRIIRLDIDQLDQIFLTAGKKVS